ncbi:MAG: OmpA family protein [Ignavibacteriaceae bacterium]|jgi:outer membrane protein OmpA-like peptidoglycan-associated protein
MKLITIISLMLLSFAQFIPAQDLGKPNLESPKPNAMSNVWGLTGEAGVTLGRTDYWNSKMNYIAKASLEYYFASTGAGNLGLRVFGESGFISGKGVSSWIQPTQEFSTKIEKYGGQVFYTVSIGDEIYPWVGVGAANLWFYPKDGNGNKLPNYVAGNYYTHMLAYVGDAGIRMMVSKSISLNLTGGIVVGTKDWLDDIQSGSNNDMLYTITAGLSYYFGREQDSDRDGVPNSEDACVNTPIGVAVDEFGCPIDTDKDGVADYLDKCANTPSGVAVDAGGCPLDADGDGVADNLDKCANTPTGVKVDANGCPLDSDSDGVADYLDKCSDTPPAAKVDANGCPLDADGDKVPDYLDKCPNTPKGVQVDAEGCPMKKETVIVIKETESLVLSGDTNFEFNKSKLLPSAYAALEGIVVTMKDHPKYKWEIGGYTDGIGSVNYNKKLSKQRAQAIQDYLVSKGVAKSNLKIVGYGKTNPVATNETVEGRSMNRRVEIKLISKGTK